MSFRTGPEVVAIGMGGTAARGGCGASRANLGRRRSLSKMARSWQARQRVDGERCGRGQAPRRAGRRYDHHRCSAGHRRRRAMMFRSVRETLRRKYITLEGPYTGRLMGEGDPAAISFEGEVGKGAVLAIHGFAGTPNEVWTVTDAARKRNLFSRGPRLAGHGPDAR